MLGFPWNGLWWPKWWWYLRLYELKHQHLVFVCPTFFSGQTVSPKIAIVQKLQKKFSAQQKLRPVRPRPTASITHTTLTTSYYAPTFSEKKIWKKVLFHSWWWMIRFSGFKKKIRTHFCSHDSAKISNNSTKWAFHWHSEKEEIITIYLMCIMQNLRFRNWCRFFVRFWRTTDREVLVF